MPPSEKNERQKLGATSGSAGTPVARSAVLSFSLIVVLELGSNALMERVELGVRCDVAFL
jgi:hypothetical protein